MFLTTAHNDDDADVINVLLKRSSSITTQYDRRRLRYRSCLLCYKHNIYLYIYL